MKIRELMTTPVVACTQDEPLAEAAKLLAVHRLGEIPVVEDGLVVGVIGIVELKAAFAQNAGALRYLKVSAVMSRDAPIARPDDPVESALRLMRKRAIGELPIVDPEGQLVGVLTLEELMRHRDDLTELEEQRDLEWIAEAVRSQNGWARPSR